VKRKRHKILYGKSFFIDGQVLNISIANISKIPPKGFHRYPAGKANGQQHIFKFHFSHFP
jgi:hypothetical protein